MLFGANKCCGCCCVDGHIDRTKNGRKCCEDAGGEWITCPEAIICACECTPSATVNDVVVAAGDPSFPPTFTFLGAEAVTPQGGFTTVEWHFWAVVDAFCIEAAFPPVYLLRVTLYVQLWCDGGSVSVGAGFFGYQAAIWEFLFTQTAKFDDHPNKWPCVQSLPALNGGPNGPDAAAVGVFFGNIGFGLGGWNNWDVEYENVAAPYFAEPTDVSLECTWSPPCE